MIDFHAHVLPGCDHGSDGIETSLKQLRLAQEAGVKTLIATPHFYPQRESLADFLERRQQTYEELVAKAPDSPQILLGAEVNLCPGLDHLEGLSKVCVQGTNILLLEMPVTYWSASLEETVVRLQDDNDYTVVLAHVDRYEPERIEQLLQFGLLAQINAESVCVHRNRRRLFRWIDEGSVVAIGSDIHGVKPGYTDFTRSLKILKDRADEIFARTQQLLDDSRI